MTVLSSALCTLISGGTVGAVVEEVDVAPVSLSSSWAREEEDGGWGVGERLLRCCLLSWSSGGKWVELSGGGNGEEGTGVPTSCTSEASELLDDATDNVEYDLCTIKKSHKVM